MAKYVILYAYDTGLNMYYDVKTAESVKEAYRKAEGRPALIFPASDVDEVCRLLRKAVER